MGGPDEHSAELCRELNKTKIVTPLQRKLHHKHRESCVCGTQVNSEIKLVGILFFF